MGVAWARVDDDVLIAEQPAIVRRLVERITPETVSQQLADEYSRPSSERGVRRREVMTPEKHAAWWRYGVKVGWWSE